MKKLLFLLVFGFLACLQPAFSQPPDIADLQPEKARRVSFCPSIPQAYPAAKCAKQPHKRRTEWNASERIRRTK